jgi:uncharacterized protein (UPF0332 family)
LSTPQQHRAQAEHNEFFVSTLQNPFWDWAVTGTFYAALQYVDAFLMSKGIDPENHPERNDYVRNDPTLRGIRSNYRELQTNSRNARYDVVSFSQDDVQSLQEELKAIKSLLIPLIPR